MSVASDISPYIDGDFVTDVTGHGTGFRGPIFHALYPPGLDPELEAFGWAGLGYRMPEGWSYDMGSGFTLRVLGEVPEWLQEKLEPHGVRFELQKQRDPVESMQHNV